MDYSQVKRIIEALLFVNEGPLDAQKIKEILDNQIDTRVINEQLEILKQEYEQQKRSFKITAVAGGYQLKTHEEFAPWIKKLFLRLRAERLSTPALETLAIIAYRQPITRADIEFIRGVNVEGVLRTLLERNLIRTCGRKDVAGRPFLYGTARKFLEYFSLNSLDELPRLKEFTAEEVGGLDYSQALSVPQASDSEKREDQNEN